MGRGRNPGPAQDEESPSHRGEEMGRQVGGVVQSGVLEVFAKGTDQTSESGAEGGMISVYRDGAPQAEATQ